MRVVRSIRKRIKRFRMQNEVLGWMLLENTLMEDSNELKRFWGFRLHEQASEKLKDYRR